MSLDPAPKLPDREEGGERGILEGSAFLIRSDRKVGGEEVYHQSGWDVWVKETTRAFLILILPPLLPRKVSMRMKLYGQLPPKLTHGMKRGHQIQTYLSQQSKSTFLI